MSVAKRYPVPARTWRVEEEIKRSRFVTTLGRSATADDARAFVAAIRTEFADATHNCWAFIAGAPGSSERIGMSDDGEPHGTAGRPMLNMLLHSGVGEIAAVVTRYYGGTKLGTGGLVRAYSGGVQLALASLPTVERVDLTTIEVSVDYAKVTAVQQLFPSFGIEVAAQRFERDAWYQLRLPEERVEGFRAAVLDLTRGQARFSS
ncbi:MAG: YigZ family protein [Bacteroidales bacterium]